MVRKLDLFARPMPFAMMVFWFVAMLAIGATLMARHVVALPRPSDNADLAAAMLTLRGPGDEGRWMAVHVLYADCRCSKRIADHLLDGERPADVREHVLYVGRSEYFERRLTDAGFALHLVTAESLQARYHMQAAPMLVLVAPSGSISYVGGYTATKQGLDPRDLQIIADGRVGRATEPLPVFGCAVSNELKSRVNPLGVP